MKLTIRNNLTVRFVVCILSAAGWGCTKKSEPATEVVIVPSLVDHHHSHPSIFALHGFLDSPEQFSKMFKDFDLPATIFLPGAPSRWYGTSWFTADFSLKTAYSEAFSSNVKKVSEYLCGYIQSKKLAKKPIVTGYSQGGILAYALAVTCPESIRLSIPIAGFLPFDIPDGKKIPPIIALHGEDDKIVDFKLDLNTIGALKAHQIQTELYSFPGVAHEISSDMRNKLYAILADPRQNE